MGFHGGSDSKESARNEGDLGSIPGLGRFPGGGGPGATGISGLHSRLIRGVSSHLEGKQRIRSRLESRWVSLGAHCVY